METSSPSPLPRWENWCSGRLAQSHKSVRSISERLQSPAMLSPASDDSRPKVTKSGFSLQFLKLYLLIYKNGWVTSPCPSLTRDQPCSRFEACRNYYYIRSALSVPRLSITDVTQRGRAVLAQPARPCPHLSPGPRDLGCFLCSIGTGLVTRQPGAQL